MRPTITILNRSTLAFACLVLASVFDAQAQTQQSTSVCNAALIPTVVESSSHVRRLYSYMWLHAEVEYDRLSKMDTRTREAQASYKLFSGEYGESQTKEQFKEKTSKRISEEKIFSDDTEITTYFRKGLEEAQLLEWSKCIAATSGAGDLLLSTRNERAKGFVLVVTWVEPNAAGSESVIELEVQDGNLHVGNKKRTSTKVRFTSSSSRAIFVSRAPSSKEVSVVANTPGFSADILSRTPSRQRPVKVIRVCNENENCAGRVLACYPSREDPGEYGNIPVGTWWQGPNSPDFEKHVKIGAVTSAIRYGKWSNSGCGREGKGWHLRAGTCTRGDEMWQRCDSVKVEVEFPPAR